MTCRWPRGLAISQARSLNGPACGEGCGVTADINMTMILKEGNKEGQNGGIEEGGRGWEEDKGRQGGLLSVFASRGDITKHLYCLDGR